MRTIFLVKRVNVYTKYLKGHNPSVDHCSWPSEIYRVKRMRFRSKLKLVGHLGRLLSKRIKNHNLVTGKHATLSAILFDPHWKYCPHRGQLSFCVQCPAISFWTWQLLINLVTCALNASLVSSPSAEKHIELVKLLSSYYFSDKIIRALVTYS